MPRTFRAIPDEGLFHVLMRGNNKKAVFHDDSDFLYYKTLIKKYKNEHDIKLYHYCLMANHVHLVFETVKQSDLSKCIKQINLGYFYYYKKKYDYYGHLWQGRYKSIIIENERYLIACGKYIELNPVRATIVKQPEQYQYSSYKYYGMGKQDVLVDKLSLYDELGKTEKEKQKVYRYFFKEEIPKKINMFYFGTERFVKRMEKRFGLKNLKGKRGRPKNIK